MRQEYSAMVRCPSKMIHSKAKPFTSGSGWPDISHCNQCGLFPAKAMRQHWHWVAGTFSDNTATISMMSLPAACAVPIISTLLEGLVFR